MYTARYPCLDFKQNEHLFLMSERGAECRMIFTEEDAKSFALARLFVAGWHFSPETDNEDVVIGTKIFYVQSADPGGIIPSSVANMTAPS